MSANVKWAQGPYVFEPYAHQKPWISLKVVHAVVKDARGHRLADVRNAAEAKLFAAAPALVEALQEAAEYIDDHVDVVDGAYGYQAPNRAMSLMNRINEALRAAGVE